VASRTVEVISKYAETNESPSDAAEVLRTLEDDDAFNRAAETMLESPHASELIREFEGEQFDQLVASVLETDDELEARFEKIPNGEALLKVVYTELKLTDPAPPGQEPRALVDPEWELTISFAYDRRVRVAAQIIAVSLMLRIMAFVILDYPALEPLLLLTGAPTPWATIVFSGKAYDKLHNKNHFHPGGSDSSAPPLRVEGQEGKDL